MRNIILIAIAALLIAAWYFTQSGTMQPNQVSRTQSPAVIVPELTNAAKTGETYYNAKCADCHGVNGAGTEKGPTFLHKVYVKGLHGDESFQRAVQLGAPSHHWKFGDMPPVPGITRAEVAKIVTYIREVQAANGM